MGEQMDEYAKMERALAMVEMCVQDMAEAGLNSNAIASALSAHMRLQIAIFLPNPAHQAIWLAAVAAPGGPA